MPGVKTFIDIVRRSRGHVAWISNRNAALTDATRDNLKAAGLWNDDDRLCLQTNAQDPKSTRRRGVATGAGECSWPRTPTAIVVFIGDQLGDFPDAGERIPDTGTDAAFGHTTFLLPNQHVRRVDDACHPRAGRRAAVTPRMVRSGHKRCLETS